MKNYIEKVGAFFTALLLGGAFYAAMLYSGVASRFLLMICGIIAFTIFVFLSTRKKPILNLIMGFTISSTLILLVTIISILIKFFLEKITILIIYLIDPIKNSMLYLTKAGYSWINYIVIGLLILIGIILILKYGEKVLKGTWSLILKIWKFFSELYVTVPLDEFHIAVYSGALFSKKIAVYSGNDISKRKNESGKAYMGNYYWNFQEIKFLNWLIGMKVRIVASDDLKKEIKDIPIKSKEMADITIGRAVLHFIIYDVITASKMWPGKDMNPDEFIKSISDIIEEAVEIVTKTFMAEELIGGSERVNTAFTKELKRKLEDKKKTKKYGIKIINAKLSQETGEIVTLITGAAKEKLRADKEVAKETAEQRIETAKEITQQKINTKMATEAMGKKVVTKIKAEAEALALKELYEMKELHTGIFSLELALEGIKANASRFPALTTMLSGGPEGADHLAQLIAKAAKTAEAMIKLPKKANAA